MRNDLKKFRARQGPLSFRTMMHPTWDTAFDFQYQQSMTEFGEHLEHWLAARTTASGDRAENRVASTSHTRWLIERILEDRAESAPVPKEAGDE